MYHIISYLYLRLFFQVHPSNPPEQVELLKPHGEVIEAELEKVEAVLKACEGIDTVLHLAAQPHFNERWDSLLKDNIIAYLST